MLSGDKSSNCLELALEGERLCRSGDLDGGIAFFHSALSKGTDDPRCLSAIYCQLGNAYFCQQNYSDALEYHRWDLTLARLTNDTIGEGQACGNLGNTLKMSGKFDEAVVCFNRQLDVATQMENDVIKSRALYNLGNVYHAKGKQWARTSGQSDPGEIPTEAAEAQRKAVEYYKKDLELVRKLGDRPAEGRINGNLGNAYYLLGNFQDAVQCHQERLNFANEFGDLAAQRRAYSNLGNAYIFLADFNSAAENYRNSLRLTQQLGDLSLEAQACYSLGNTYILLRDPSKAIVFHLRHLVIARRLGDRVGEGRAHWSLTNAYTALGRYQSALRCARRHRLIANEMHDQIGYMTAQLMIREICGLISSSPEDEHAVAKTTAAVDESDENSALHVPSLSSQPISNTTPINQQTHQVSALTNQYSVANRNQFYDEDVSKTTGVQVDSEGDQNGSDLDASLDVDLELELAATAADILDTVEVVTRGEDGKLSTVRLGCLDFPTISPTLASESKRDEIANFYSDVPAFRHNRSVLSSEARHLDDVEEQLETLTHINSHHQQPTHQSSTDSVPVETGATEEEQAEDQQEFFYTLLLNSQSRRMDEQRCCLRSSQLANGTTAATTTTTPNTAAFPTQATHDPAADEAMFDLIEGVQGDRMDDQRASLPAFPGLRAGPGLQLFEAGSLANLHRGSASDNMSTEPGQPAVFNGTSRELDDDFLDMILRLQTVTRIEDQRTNLPDPVHPTNGDTCPSTDTAVTHTSDGDVTGLSVAASVCPTVPNEDFFALIQRVQSTRLEEQRCNPPPPTNGVILNNLPQTRASVSNASSSDVGASSTQRESSSSFRLRRHVGSWHRVSSRSNK